MSHNIIKNMYIKKPKIDENGNMVFNKSGMFLFIGILFVSIFSLCTLFMDYYVPEIIKENNLSIDMTGSLYIAGYSLTALFTIIGLEFIIMYFKHKIIISKDEIIAQKMLSKKVIKISDIEKVTFSNGRGLIFRDRYTKIAFGNFTIGLIEVLKFVEKNVPKEKCETAIQKAKKMLMNNRVIEFYTLQ